MIQDASAQALIRQRNLNKSMEMLMGLITGIVADDHLHDLEIKFINTWLTEHADVASVWPGSAVASLLSYVLADGVITTEERSHMLETLRQLAVTDFAMTGSASPEVLSLPIDDKCHIALRDASLCLTGEFIFGTRNKCESITTQFGATTHGTVTRRIDYLVVGTKVSPNWAHTSYGRKIEQAVALQQEGHSIRIISERRWLAALS